jgi:hypothetical protein
LAVRLIVRPSVELLVGHDETPSGPVWCLDHVSLDSPDHSDDPALFVTRNTALESAEMPPDQSKARRFSTSTSKTSGERWHLYGARRGRK